MRQIAFALLFLTLAAAVAAAQTKDVKFQWDQNDPQERVIKYILKIGPAAGNWTITQDVTAPVYQTDDQGNLINVPTVLPPMEQVVNLTIGKWYAIVTATNEWGESLPSNQVQTPAGKPNKPGIFKRLLAWLGILKTHEAWEFVVE